MRNAFLTLPTALTWTRILAIPFLVGVFSWPLDLEVVWQNRTAAALFAGFALTDWLDGYLARKLKQTSAFGAFLDPVADKFWVCAALLILVHLQRIDLWVSFIIIGREMAVLALREWMALLGASSPVAVHLLGKLKTVLQMVAITLLLLHENLLGINLIAWGRVLIWASALLTLWSMLYYLYKALPEIRSRMQAQVLN